MCLLSDGSIIKRRGLSENDPRRITIDNMLDPTIQIQPASVDLRLGPELDIGRGRKRDLSKEDILLSPGKCCLATTMERVAVPTDLSGRVEGKSTIGRQHVIVHCTAGFLDPGFGYTGDGPNEITLEIVNHSEDFFLLTLGMYICQLTFSMLDAPALRPYQGKYKNQTGGPAPARKPLTDPGAVYTATYTVHAGTGIVEID